MKRLQFDKNIGKMQLSMKKMQHLTSGSFQKVVVLTILVCMAFLMEERLWNPDFGSVTVRGVAVNICLEAVLLFGLLLVFRRVIPVGTGVLILNWVYGTINHFVYEFRGTPPLYGDFLVADTALTVAKGYHFSISAPLVDGTLTGLVAFAILLIFYPRRKKRIKITKERVYQMLQSVVCGIVLTAVLWGSVLQLDIDDLFDMKISGWNPEESFCAYGAPVTLLISAQNRKMSKPDGYNSKAVEELLDTYPDNVEQKKSRADRQPSVIVIMNEAFSDLSVFEELDTANALSAFYDIDRYARRGYAYVSTCGGGTCNSEFEFLTGASLIHLSTGMYPYQSFDLSEASSLVQVFKKLGYETKAFHPYDPENWNRIEVYDEFGFDEFLSYDDMDDVSSYSWTVSDRADYEKVKEIYENRTKPLFLFNVTMQNHGSYDVDLYGLEQVYSSNNSSEQLSKYLTLVKESSEAFADLIEYFSKQKDPVVVVMFGDHQPNLDNGFFDRYWNKSEMDIFEKRYMTPYIIWSNYYTGHWEEEKDLGLNYLGADLLDILGVKTEYSSYLLDLQKEIPIMNAGGYQEKNGTWHKYSAANDALKEYYAVQYYQLFDE